MKKYVFSIKCFSLAIIMVSVLVTQADSQCLYDFEQTRQGWVAESHSLTRGALSAKRSRLVAFSGEYSLKAELHLSKEAPEFTQAEIRVDIQSYPPEGMSWPLNFDNTEITVYVYVPEEFEGQAGSPNGIQVFAKSDKDVMGQTQWRSLYGQWVDAAGQSGDWIEVKLFISDTPRDGIYIEDGFNPKSIRFIGVKFGLGGDASADVTFSGDVFVDCISW